MCGGGGVDHLSLRRHRCYLCEQSSLMPFAPFAHIEIPDSILGMRYLRSMNMFSSNLGVSVTASCAWFPQTCRAHAL